MTLTLPDHIKHPSAHDSTSSSTEEVCVEPTQGISLQPQANPHPPSGDFIVAGQQVWDQTIGDLDAFRAKQGFKKAADSIWVKTGDHSISAQGITSDLLLNDTSTEAGPGNFIQMYGGVMKDNFDYEVNQAIRVGSLLGVFAPGGGTTPFAMHWGRVLRFHEAPIAAGEPLTRHDLHVHSTEPRTLGQFSIAEFSDFNSGRHWGWQPGLLPIANCAAKTRLTSAIKQGNRWFDNQMLYAKLFFWSMVLDEFSFAGTTPAAVGNPIAGNPQWIDLNGANLDPEILPSLIMDGHIIFIDGVDLPYSTCEPVRRMLCWLAWAGSRVDGQPAVGTPHSCYLQWPAIQIVVLGRGADVPAIPAAALPSSLELMRFAMGIADCRQEWSSLNRGLYAAMDQIGIRFNKQGGHFWPLKSDLSPCNPSLPAPRDYNFMYRFLHKYPESPVQDVKSEAMKYASLNGNERTCTFALYTAIRATATTTLLYDLNLRISDLNAFMGGAAELDPILNTVLCSGLNFAHIADANSEPAAIYQPKKAFKLWVGAGVEDGLYPQVNWIGNFGKIGANGANSYAGVVTIPPRFCSPLVIWDWLTIRPIEWGFVGPSPIINLSNEFRTHHSEVRTGWYADLGSSLYSHRVMGSTPMELVVYGPQAVNAVCQLLRRAAAAAPTLSHRCAAWSHGAHHMSWDPPAADALNQHTYVAALFGFEPCTIMSFNYATNEVYSPAIVGPALAAGDRNFLRFLSAGSAPTGYVGVPITNIQVPYTGGLDLTGILGSKIGALTTGAQAVLKGLAPEAQGPPAGKP